MTTEEQDVETHNAREIRKELVSRIEAARHEIGLVLGLFEDLAMYEGKPRAIARLQQIEGELEGHRDAIERERP